MHKNANGDASAPAPRVPHATYRLQLHKAFTLDDAAKIAPYLARLGVSDCYTSPIFRATPGSTHGYDVCDHNEIGPELGSSAAYGRFNAALREHGLGHLVDFVPNHMGISTDSNPWWRDVLENGPCSVSARFFDIDWEPAETPLRNKVLLPILGDQYGLTLERGELRLVFEQGLMELEYAGQRLPVNPRQTPIVYRVGLDALESRLGTDHPDVLELLSILSSLHHLPPYTVSTPEAIEERQREKEVARHRLAALVGRSPAVRAHIESAVTTVNGTPGDRASFDTLHELLEAQPYRLASWRTAADEINYRRFFDINTLAGVRVEDPVVFDAIHALLKSLIADRLVTGVRIDHPDGLFDPAKYFEDLQAMAREASGADAPPMYVLAEKILSGEETLPEDWEVHGTTGYDFLNDVTGLFIDGRNGRRLRRIYQRFTGRDESWRLVCQRSKRLIMDTAMASELSVLADALERLAKSTRQWRDFTRHSLRDALVALVACFPVYRTYITTRGWSARDAEVIDEAMACARRGNPAVEGTVFAFLRDVLLPKGDGHDAELQFAMKLQQYTAPVQAKGVEDTAFYRYNTLLALNEVGGDPSRVGRTPKQFHAAMLARAASWPFAMTATATHDTKLGEDTRARIAAISEIPEEWQRNVLRWSRLTRAARAKVYGEPAPDHNDEYRFYQVLAGIWPAQLDANQPLPADLVERLQQYMDKASREAKLHTSWINPHEEYDRATREFVHEVLAGETARSFLPAFVPFAQALARVGAANSLGQLLIKTAAPGVPDFYQGTELWDLTLVDPDNRRPVDFDLRCRMARDLDPLVRDARAGSGDAAARVAALLESWPDGRIKLFTTLAALGLRREQPGLFLRGQYVPLHTTVPPGAEAVAFARVHDGSGVIAIAPTLTHGIAARHFALGEAWGDGTVTLPAGMAGAVLVNVLTGERIQAVAGEATPHVRLADVFRTAPIALLAAP